jgi:type VI secretion system protein ImpB
MSDSSFQKEKPPARINLFLEVLKGNARKKVELPLRMLVMGDFTGRDDATPLAEREAVNVNNNNFDGVLKSMGVRTEFTVPDRQRGGDEEMKVALRVESMRDFHPEQVARQIPQLARMIAARNLLQDLRNRVISTSEFRKGLEQIVRDPAALDQLIGELDRVVPANPPALPAET